MTQKGRTTVYIDKEQAARVKNEYGLDTSTLTSQALDIVESNEFSDLALELRLKLLDNVITETTTKLTEAQNVVLSLNKRLEGLQVKRSELIQNYESNKRGILLSKLTYNLNNMIIRSQYDIPTILGNSEAVAVIEQIKAASPLWQLEVHVKDLKANMSRYR